MEWYLKAAHQENSIAQLAIGCFYEDGKGVKSDLSLAYYWYIYIYIYISILIILLLGIENRLIMEIIMLN
jgi:hypothetical protein